MTVPSLEIGMERFWEQVFHKAVPVFMCVSSSYAMRCKEPHAPDLVHVVEGLEFSILHDLL